MFEESEAEQCEEENREQGKKQKVGEFFRQGPDYKGPFSKIKSFEPQTNNKGQLLKYLEVGNEIEWGMDWVGKAW